MAIPLTAVILCGTVIYIDWIQYRRDSSKNEHQGVEGLDVKLDDLKTELEDYKKRVDALTLKAGFKL
jgi:hypothetical protein